MRSFSPGILFLGILAVLFGLIGAHGAKKYLNERQLVTPQPANVDSPATLSVPLAVRDLPKGREVTLGDFTTARLTDEQIRRMDFPVEFMTRSSTMQKLISMVT